MDKWDDPIETGAVIARRECWRGPLLTVAITLTEREWDELSSPYNVLWHHADDNDDLRSLTREECIALFLTSQVGCWFEPDPTGDDLDDLDDDAPC